MKEEILEKLRPHNEFLASTKVFLNAILVAERPNKKGKYYSIIKTDGESYKMFLNYEIVNKRWNRCKIIDAVSIRRCYKFLGFSHTVN